MVTVVHLREVRNSTALNSVHITILTSGVKVFEGTQQSRYKLQIKCFMKFLAIIVDKEVPLGGGNCYLHFQKWMLRILKNGAALLRWT